MHNTINLDKVNVHFEEKRILKNVTFDVKPKNPTCIVGKGLSGKSTILKSIIGLTKISSGEIKINNISTTEKNLIQLLILWEWFLKRMRCSMV